MAPPPSTDLALPVVSDPYARERLSEWHLRQARISLDQTNYLEAALHAERALELNPGSLDAKQLLLEIRQEQLAMVNAEQMDQAPFAPETTPASGGIQAPGVHEYRVGVGDVLDVMVWQDVHPLSKQTPQAQAKEEPREEEREYHVHAGDILEVFIWQQQDLTRDVIVRPDGMISFPLVGDVKAEKLTLTQLDEMLTERLTIYLKEPDVSLALKRAATGPAVAAGKPVGFGQVVPELSREVIVRPDGRLAFPLIGDLPAEQLTLTEIDQTITQRLKQYVRRPDVTLAIKRFGGTKTIVLGEVTTPGVYIPAGEGRILEVVAMAGGFTKNANKRNVMLMRGGLMAPEVIKLNLDRVLTKGLLEDNLALQPNDILYVPKGAIASTLEFMEQFYPTISEVLVAQGVANGFGFSTTFSDNFRKTSGKTFQ